jgi:hypothetical protein
MIDLSCDFRESVVGRSGQRRYIDAAGHCSNERLFLTWELDGGVMVLDSQRPAIGSPIRHHDAWQDWGLIDNRVSHLVHRRDPWLISKNTTGAAIERMEQQTKRGTLSSWALFRS